MGRILNDEELDEVRANIVGDITVHRVAESIRAAGWPVGDATVLDAYDRLRPAAPRLIPHRAATVEVITVESPYVVLASARFRDGNYHKLRFSQERVAGVGQGRPHYDVSVWGKGGWQHVSSYHPAGPAQFVGGNVEEHLEHLTDVALKVLA